MEKYLVIMKNNKVVHARHADIVSKENMFGQVTVRFHTQQQLAVYDRWTDVHLEYYVINAMMNIVRFGRLIHGSEVVAKDVLEYVVFEKHLSNV